MAGGVTTPHRRPSSISLTATESIWKAPAALGERGMGMLQSDTDYFRQRATTEREMALKAADPRVADVHLELARGYDALAKGPEAPALLSAVA